VCDSHAGIRNSEQGSIALDYEQLIRLIINYFHGVAREAARNPAVNNNADTTTPNGADNYSHELAQ
jgi:hypothetical protein